MSYIDRPPLEGDWTDDDFSPDIPGIVAPVDIVFHEIYSKNKSDPNIDEKTIEKLEYQQQGVDESITEVLNDRNRN